MLLNFANLSTIIRPRVLVVKYNMEKLDNLGSYIFKQGLSKFKFVAKFSIWKSVKERQAVLGKKFSFFFFTRCFKMGFWSLKQWVDLLKTKKVYAQKQSRRVFCKKGVLRNLAKSTGKRLCQSLFFNKVACFVTREAFCIQSSLHKITSFPFYVANQICTKILKSSKILSAALKVHATTVS